MKRIFIAILLLISVVFCSPCFAAVGFYSATSLTGSGTGALDAIDGTRLADGAAAYVVTATGFYVYHLDASSGVAESSPDVISPDSNAGNKRWILVSRGTRGTIPQFILKTNVADTAYGTSALTSDYIVAFTSLTAARAAVISSEDVASGTATQPRIMIFKDESGNAGTYPITISLESGGTINGASTYVLNTNYEAVNIYLNGTNGFAY